MELESIWKDYGLDELQAGIATLFPQYDISLSDMLQKLLQGDVIGVLADFMQESIAGMAGSVIGMKNVFVWLLVLGVVSALMSHFVEVFDRHQVADLSFYFMYLLMAAILLKCFVNIAQVAVEAMENIVLFIRLLVPTYLLAVGIATGSVTVGAYYQLLLIMIYGVEQVLLGVVLPLIYSFCMLTVVNGIWIEEKLTLLVEFLEKIIGWILKASLGLVTGISIFQAVLTPALDSVKKGVLQKAVSAIPGIGNAADGVVELVLGSAVVIKNSVGIVLLLLLLLLCAVPLFRIFLTAVLLKAAAAFMGIVSDKRITTCANRTGDAGILLFKTTGTAMLLFLITIAVVAATTNGGN
jgi:stage III sporulation protein AE